MVYNCTRHFIVFGKNMFCYYYFELEFEAGKEIWHHICYHLDFHHTMTKPPPFPSITQMEITQFINK